MTNRQRDRVNRRGFLKKAAAGAAAGTAALVGGTSVQGAQAAAAAQQPAGETTPRPADVYTTDRPGADFMVDVIKSLGFEYIAANPGSTFRGLHESIINYGGNKMPELLTCCHEESSVAMAHGYVKIEGKPMIVMAHGTVGLQHASMAIYNAFADRVPVYIVLGNILDITCRRSDVEWTHSVQDAAAMVRDYTKWDDKPASLSHFAESAVRAYKVAMTPPMEPVVIVADADLAGRADAGRRSPDGSRPEADARLAASGGLRGDCRGRADARRRGESAHHRRARAREPPNGLKLLVELAESAAGAGAGPASHG